MLVFIISVKLYLICLIWEIISYPQFLSIQMRFESQKLIFCNTQYRSILTLSTVKIYNIQEWIIQHRAMFFNCFWTYLQFLTKSFLVLVSYSTWERYYPTPPCCFLNVLDRQTHVICCRCWSNSSRVCSKYSNFNSTHA